MTISRNIINIKDLDLTYEDTVPQADDIYHSRIGEDTPDFSKFASGDVNWWHGTRVEVKATIKPKTHIVCDPSFEPSEEYWREFVVKNKCDIYVLIENRLTKVNTLGELQFYVRFATPYEDEKEVHQIAAPYGLKAKQIKVVHYGNRIKIINELSNRKSCPVIDLNEFVNITENYFSKQIMTVAKESKVILKVGGAIRYPLMARYLSIITRHCNIENIIYDCRIVDESCGDRDIARLIDKSKVDHFITSSLQEVNLLAKQNPGLKHLTYIGSPNDIDSELLKSLESLSCETCDTEAYSVESISDLLDVYPKLNKLVLKMSIYYNEGFKFGLTSLISKLKVLHLTGEIDLESLVILLANCSYLEEIEFNDLTIFNHENIKIDLFDFELTDLKKIRVNRVNDSDDRDQMDCGPLFFKIIEKSRNLEVIDIQSSLVTATDKTRPILNFPKLSHLTIKTAERKHNKLACISEDVILKMLCYSVQLSYLDLCLHADTERAETLYISGPFPLLEFVSFNHVSNAFCCCLLLKRKTEADELDRFSNLRILSINNSVGKFFKGPVEFYSFPELRSLSVHNADVPIRGINTLLASSHRLQSLDIENVIHISYNVSPSFEALSLSGESTKFYEPMSTRCFAKVKFLDINANGCLPVLSQTTELQTLEITIDDKSTLPEKLAFPQLTKLVLIVKSHNAEVELLMKRLVASAPNLKKLCVEFQPLRPQIDHTIGFLTNEAVVSPFAEKKSNARGDCVIDLSRLEELQLLAVTIPEGGEQKLGQLKLLELRNCMIPTKANILDSAERLEILTGHLGGGYAAGQVPYILKLIDQSRTLKNINLSCFGFHVYGKSGLQKLGKALSGKKYQSLVLSSLPSGMVEMLASEFPHGVSLNLSSDSLRQYSRLSLRKSIVPQITSQVLDNEVIQREITTVDVTPYISSKTSLPIDEYRETIFPHLVINENGEIEVKVSIIQPKVCKIQPEQTTNLYQQFCKLTRDDEKNYDYYYVEKVLEFPPSTATLTGCTPVDEIKAFEASARVTFLQNEETGQYSVSSNSQEVKIAYLVKAKKGSYIRNHTTADKFKMDEVKKIVADFHFVHDEKSNKMTIAKGEFCSRFTNNAIFLAAVALTTDEKTWCSKEKELLEKNIDFTKLKGVALLDAIREHTTGACRHQAYFIKALADALGIRCQMIQKDNVHTFVEFTLNVDGKDTVYSERLGGYAANLNVKKSPPGQLFTQPAESVSKKSKSTKSLSRLSLPPIVETKDTAKSLSRLSIPPIAETKNTDKEEKIAQPDKVLTVVKTPFKQFYRDFMTKLDQQASENEKTGLLYVSNGEGPLLSCMAKLMEATKEQRRRSHYIDDIANVPTDSLAVKDSMDLKVGSDLKQFLEQAQTGDVLIIRCPKEFSSRSLLYNAMDGTRHIKNMKIPPGVKIIGIVEKENITTERAFQRRFKIKPRDVNDLVDVSVDMPIDYLADQCIADKPVDDKCISKDFCGGDLYKQDLFGTPDFKTTGACFEPGLVNEIVDCKAANPIVEIINSGNEREQKLALLTMMASGEAFVNGEWLKVPKFRLLKVDRDYDFSRACQFETTADENINQATYILNPTTYPSFLINYGGDEKTHHLLTPDGLLANFKGKSLTIRATHTLKKPGHWQRFFTEAKKQGIFLRILRDPGVEIPGLPTIEAIMPMTCMSSLSILLSKTPYEDVTAYADEFKPDLMVNVGRTHYYTDLIQRLVPAETKAGDLPRYDCQIGQVARALIGGQTVMLVGDLSTRLAESLETLSAIPPYLMINGVPQPVKGKLLLLTNNDKLLRTCYQESKQMPVKPIRKLEVKEDKYSISDPNDEQEIRMKAVCARLSTSPCALLEGPTAAGKSTAIRRYLAKYYGKPVTLFEGIKSLDKFAEFAKGDMSDHVLFIDECDLQQEGAFDIFEGAYNPVKPNLLARLAAIDWHPNMKVVFAGNGSSYHARIIHEFFNRHQDMRVDFPAFSREFIRNYILKALLRALLPRHEALFDKILDIFFAASHYVKEPRVVTLRNWSQMCLRLALRPEGDIVEAAKLAVYDELSGMQFEPDLPAFQTYLFGSPEACANRLAVVDNTAARKLASKLNELERSRLVKGKRDPVDRFILTPNRYHEARMIMDALAIRDLRQQHVDTLPEIRYHGTFGTVLTGSSEVGKSAMVVEILQALGFKDGVDAAAGKKYCSLTAFNAKEANIAFHEGSVVVRDEYNATFNEANDNGHLSAVDNDGHDAKQMGWTMFATENPVDHDGRIVPSKAAANRCHYVAVKSYTMLDYRLILQGWGLSQSSAVSLLKTKKDWNLGDLRDAARQQLLLQPSVAKRNDGDIRGPDFVEIPQIVSVPGSKRSSSMANHWGMFAVKTLVEALFTAGAIVLYTFFPQLLAVKVLAIAVSSIANVSFLNRLRKVCCVGGEAVYGEKHLSPSSHARMSSVISIERNAHVNDPVVVKEDRLLTGLNQRQRDLRQEVRLSISPRM